MLWLFMRQFHNFQKKKEVGFVGCVIKAVSLARSKCKYHTFFLIVVHNFHDRWLCCATLVVRFYMKSAKDFISVLNFWVY